jgi:hypothetical protein
MDLMDSIAEALRADGAGSPSSCSCVLVVMITCYYGTCPSMMADLTTVVRKGPYTFVQGFPSAK